MANPFEDYLGGMGGSFTTIVGSTISIVIKLIAGILLFALIIGFFLWKRNARKYNIPVTIWIPRSDGKITDEIKAKGGYFKSKKGVTTFRLKRKKLSTIDIPPPSSRFLVGLSRKLYLVQKGVDDFEAVLPDSFRSVETPGGKKIAVINLKAINQDATAWVEDNRENAKRRFTFSNVWEKYKEFIQMMIFIFIVAIMIYINWMGLKDVVVALQQVADTLRGPAPIIT